MRDRDRTFLTLEERLEMARRSRAASPEAAARLVKLFSEIPTSKLFFGKNDVNAMYELTGEFWKHPEVDMDSYRRFIRSCRLAVSRDNDVSQLPLSEMPLKEQSPYETVWGVRTNNAMVLLGLMLLDHAKGSLRPKDICRCTRMTLGQYLDALVDLSFREDGTQDEDRMEFFWIWRKVLLKDNDGSRPLEEALAEIVRRYIAAWQEFDHLDHILRCMGGLSCYLEQEEAGRTLSQEKEDSIRRFRVALCQYGSDLEGWDLVETARRYLDPYGYYFTLACEYPEDVPDPGSKDVAPGTLRSQIFLSERDYSPDVLRELAAKSPFTDLRELLEKYIQEKRLASAAREINTAVTALYTLWVEPYLRMEEYHYEKHME